MDRHTVKYVYCVIPASVDPAQFPGGIDGAAVHLLACDELAAVVSTLEASDYAGDSFEALAADPAWLAPRAVAHDSIVTVASDNGPVVPLPMWVMFSDACGVARMLATQADVLTSALARVHCAREFGVRVTGDAAALAAAAVALHASIAELERRRETASPGQAYLLARKLDEARRTAVRNVGQTIAQHVHDELSERSRASTIVRPRASAGDPGVLLDAAYLVADDSYDSFRGMLTELVGRYAPHGCRFDFTGPWPPYHFARADA